MVQFPAPIGGTVLPDDFAPSILFAVLYAILVPLMLYRMLDRRSRCTILIGTVLFSVERVVIFSLRATQARDDSRRFSNGLVTYQQISFGMGFIGIASDAVGIVRCLLVNATYGLEKYFQSPAAATKGVLVPPPTADTPDHPRVRSWCRYALTFLVWAFFGAIVPEIIANSNYSQVFNDQTKADSTANNRFASTAVTVALSGIMVCITLWGLLELPRIGKRGVAIVTAIYTLVLVIGVYRLSIMWIRTPLLSDPSPLNTPRSKAAFYIFHVLPEWLAILILLGNNIRKIFGTGLVGDKRLWDETEKEREDRLTKEAKQEAKRQGKKTHLAEKVEIKGQV